MDKKSAQEFLELELSRDEPKSKADLIEELIGQGRSKASAYRDWEDYQEKHGPQLSWDDFQDQRRPSKNGEDTNLIFETFRTAIPLYQAQNKHLEACKLASDFASVKKQLRSF